MLLIGSTILLLEEESLHAIIVGTAIFLMVLSSILITYCMYISIQTLKRIRIAEPLRRPFQLLEGTKAPF